MIESFKKVLIFAAHHDDEVIGAAGTIKKLVDLGIEVDVVFATDGSTGVDHTRSFEKRIKSVRIEESENVARFLGIKNTYNWSESCQNLKYSARLLQKAIKQIRKTKPDLIITHTTREKHIDHCELSKIVTQAAWKSSEDILPNLGEVHRVEHVWGYEVVDVYEKIDYIVDISDTFKYKLQAMAMYNSQTNVVSGINQLMTGLSMMRGYEIGVKHAEGFKNINTLPTRVIK